MQLSSDHCGFVDMGTEAAHDVTFKLLADSIPQLVWISGPDGSVEFINKRCEEYTGRDSDVSKGWGWVPTLHPDDQMRSVENWTQAMKSSEPYESEVRIQRKDGQYRWHLCRAIALKNDQGKVLKWVGTATDIHDQRSLQDALAEGEAHFRTIADCMPHILWTADALGQMDFFNARWFEYTGLTKEQSEKDAWRLLVHPDDLPEFVKEWKRALETGDTCEAEFRLKRTLGLAMNSASPYRWHLHRAVALRRTDGTIAKWFATWTEIEDQMRKNNNEFEQVRATQPQPKQQRD